MGQWRIGIYFYWQIGLMLKWDRGHSIEINILFMQIYIGLTEGASGVFILGWYWPKMKKEPAYNESLAESNFNKIMGMFKK